MQQQSAASRKRARTEEEEGAELASGSGGAATIAAATSAAAAGGGHAAAATSIPAAAAAPSSTIAAVAADAAAEASGSDSASGSGSDSDSDDESDVSELVVVRMPASLVQQMRERGDSSVEIRGLDSGQPHFDASYAMPLPAHLPAAQPAMHRFVGAYEYSVGTQLLWKIKDGQIHRRRMEKLDTTERTVG